MPVPIAVVIKALNSALGLLLGQTGLGKVRESLAGNFKDGDLVNEGFRKIIITDLAEIKAGHECLSLKDLNGSYSFLKEGLTLLNHALDTSNEEDQKASEAESPAREATRVWKDTASGILNAALSLPEAIQRLGIASQERFVSAKDRFRASRETATHAFNNKSLSIKDRIMACKLRVAAGILETGLEDPVAAIACCLLTLEELHGLPAVREIFSVFLEGSWKSRFKKEERLDNIMSVLFINQALFDFAAKYNSEYPNVFTWPGIKLTDRQFNPILNAQEILTANGEETKQQLNRVLTWPIDTGYVAVNSKGEIIALYNYMYTITSPSSRQTKEFSFADAKTVHAEREAITVDSDDNVYILISVLKCDVGSTGNKLYNRLLYVFDRNHKVNHTCVLDIFDEDKTILANIAVDEKKNISIIKGGDSNVYVFDSSGKLKYKFKRDGDEPCSLSISKTNDIMISSCDRRIVQIFSPDGKLKSCIDVPEDHEVTKMAYHHRLGKIIVRTKHINWEFTALLCYSEAGELEHTVYLNGQQYCTNITSHPSGPFLAKYNETVTLI